MAIKLNERTVPKIAVPERGTTTVWDQDLAGFGVRVSPKGMRTFFLDYRSPVDARLRRFRIGTFDPDTAASARERAEKVSRQVFDGEDPMLAKAARIAAPTVRELAERYIREHLPEKVERSQKEDKTIIDKEILPYRGKDGPVLADRKVADIHQGDMKALHAALTKRGVPVRANRVLSVASKMFSLALIPEEGEAAPWRDRAQGNPCQGVKRNSEQGMERYLSAQEIAALTDAIAARGSTPATNCVRLIMLTGCRPGEALAATWPEFDVEPGRWVKPSAHTKQKRIHRVPLSPGAIELLEQIRKARKKSDRAKNSPYVFPGQKAGEPIKQLRSTWDELSDQATVLLWSQSPDPAVKRLVAGLQKSLPGRRMPACGECKTLAAHLKIELPPHLTDARLYDLRHSFASIGAGRGLSIPLIGRLLGHTVAKTTMRYSHFADDPLDEAVKTIGAVIEGAGKAGAEVVPLRRGR